jgi:hypothetical protein
MKSRISSGQTDKMPTDGWDNAEVLNPIRQYINMLPDYKEKLNNENEITLVAKCDKGQSKITVKYNPNSMYDYFTTRSTTHDGTLLFTLEAIEELLFRPFKLATLPKDARINQDNFTNYDYEYIIGDVIIHRDFGIKNINGNNWSGETDTIVLPIKFNTVEH